MKKIFVMLALSVLSLNSFAKSKEISVIENPILKGAKESVLSIKKDNNVKKVTLTGTVCVVLGNVEVCSTITVTLNVPGPDVIVDLGSYTYNP
ncbi:MAG: hypothetical protein SFU27_01565 [Thermonemataceae bacterium]|nr:hypothetical protein [Thermonemataceae bacterium]